MVIEAGKCQMCGGPYDRKVDQLYSETLPWRLNPHSRHCCSPDCLVNALEAVGAYQMRRRLKNFPSVSFESFQEVFGFNEDGGYARSMYDMLRQQPLQFLFRLDEVNYLKFIKGRL